MTSHHRRAILPILALVWVIGGSCATAVADEADRIAELLALAPGERAADVGAGDGAWAVALARKVGPEGRVWATEVEADLLAEIDDRAASEGLTNLTTVLGDQEGAGLPDRCCDAILLRLVYHHFVNPAPMRASILRSLRPGGRLLIIDIVPQVAWRELPGVPDRGGHGITPDEVVADLEAAGFELVSKQLEWNGDPDRYALLFTLR